MPRKPMSRYARTLRGRRSRCTPTAPPTSNKGSQRLLRVGELVHVDGRLRSDQRLDVVEHVPDVDVHAGQYAVVAVEPEHHGLETVEVTAESHPLVIGCPSDVFHAEVVLIREEVRQLVVF